MNIYFEPNEICFVLRKLHNADKAFMSMNDVVVEKNKKQIIYSGVADSSGIGIELIVLLSIIGEKKFNQGYAKGIAKAQERYRIALGLEKK